MSQLASSKGLFRRERFPDAVARVNRDVLVPSSLRDADGNVVVTLVGDEAFASSCDLPVVETTRKGRDGRRIVIPPGARLAPGSVRRAAGSKFFDAAHDHTYAATKSRACPSPVLGVMVDEKREVFLHPFLERFVQTLILLVLSLHAEQILPHTILAYRCVDGVHAGLFMAKALLRRGFVWAARADVRNYFPSITINHVAASLPVVLPVDDAMMTIIAARMSAPIVRRPDHRRVVSGEVGVRAEPLLALYQGSSIAPVLSNIVGYVIFDAPFALAMGTRAILLRYADDLLVLARERAGAAEGLQLLHDLASRTGLALHPDPAKTSPEPIDLRGANINFLGYDIGHGGVRLSGENFDTVIERLRDTDPCNRRLWSRFVDAVLRLSLDPASRLDDLREAAGAISRGHLHAVDEAAVHVKLNLRTTWISKFQAFADPIVRGAL